MSHTAVRFDFSSTNVSSKAYSKWLQEFIDLYNDLAKVTLQPFCFVKKDADLPDVCYLDLYCCQSYWEAFIFKYDGKEIDNVPEDAIEIIEPARY